MVGTEKVFRINLGWNDPGRANICGQGHSNWNERIMNIDVIVEHSSPEAEITISSTLD
jgi:hypothetical protein